MTKGALLNRKNKILQFCSATSYNHLSPKIVDLSDFRDRSGLLKEPKNKTLDRLTNSVVWVAARCLELCLFNYLQKVSNSDLDELPIGEQKVYIVSMIKVLIMKLNFTTQDIERSTKVNLPTSQKHSALPKSNKEVVELGCFPILFNT